MPHGETVCTTFSSQYFQYLTFKCSFTCGSSDSCFILLNRFSLSRSGFLFFGFFICYHDFVRGKELGMCLHLPSLSHLRLKRAL